MRTRYKYLRLAAAQLRAYNEEQLKLLVLPELQVLADVLEYYRPDDPCTALVVSYTIHVWNSFFGSQVRNEQGVLNPGVWQAHLRQCERQRLLLHLENTYLPPLARVEQWERNYDASH